MGGQPKGQKLSPDKVNNFFFTTQPLIELIPEAVLPGLKQPVHEANHSPVTSARIKKTYI
jgi:hypothetical protein